MHNLKSRYKPFIVFEPGNRMKYLRDMNVANLSKPGSGNHWPEGQILSDGRTSLAADRGAHFLGFPISEPPLNRGADGRDYRCSLYGMTDRPFSELVELARSWSRAPELRVVRGGFTSLGYDRSERAYRLSRSAEASPSVELSLARLARLPRAQPRDRRRGLGRGGGLAPPRRATRAAWPLFRFGHRRTLEGTDLVAWIEVRRDAPSGPGSRPGAEQAHLVRRTRMLVPIPSYRARLAGAALLVASLLAAPAAAPEEERGIPPAPPRAEGEGPWKRLILRAQS